MSQNDVEVAAQPVGPVPLVEHPGEEAVLPVDTGSQHAAGVTALADLAWSQHSHSTVTA